MPNRILREGIIESERVDRLSCEAEVFYRRGMSVVDDFGRYYAKPELLLAALFPLRVATIRPADVAKWLQECVVAKLIRVYTVDGKDFLEYVDFRQQLRLKKSKFPSAADQASSECAAEATQTTSSSTASAHLDGDGDGDVSGAARDAAAVAEEGYSPEFEEAWTCYPKRQGGNSKQAAWKAWRARLRAGASAAILTDGIRRYAAFVRASGKEGTEFVKQAATFLGPDAHYAEAWAIPKPAVAGAPRYLGNEL